MPILHLHRLNRILCLLAVLALGSLTVAPAAYAQTLTVCPSGCEFTAIQPAIDSASSGDAIRIFSGVYGSEGGPTAVKITDKSLVLEGVGATVLDYLSNFGSCEELVQLSCSKNHRITIKRLTIRDGGDAHSGANLSNRGCKLRLINSAVIESQGLGINHQGRGTLTIKNSEVYGNDGGINIAESKAFIINSTINHNRSLDRSGIFNGGTLHLSHSTMSNTLGFGGAIWNRGTLIVKHSSIFDNEPVTPLEGGGVTNDGVATIEDSLIARNGVDGEVFNGGGILNAGKLTLIRSTVLGNSASDSGGGIANRRDARLRLIDTLVTGNFAGRDGGGVFNDGGTVSQTKTLIIKNTPNDCVGC